MRLPLRALPLAIRVVRFARTKLLWRIGDALSDLEGDLRSMVEPQTVDDLAPRCFECQATGSFYCDKCQVLAKGRVN